ncbi:MULTISPECIES: DUF3987 domain-containing protein [unclassified Synechococcus]|uniref:DUF3987 domain-containing protein n=1 Tax=unclassified Synechococcus TaxID=2626047 RepID=UPI001C2450F3|nr:MULTISPECIES: DUF3987 domain-containing protein [unclassified Synechococcus]
MTALALQDARTSLEQALASGIDAASLEQQIEALSAKYDTSQQTLRNMAAAIRDQLEQQQQLADETATLLGEMDRHALGLWLTLDYLLPASIAAALRAITRHLPYDDPAIALAFLAGQSGLAKLGTRICGNPLTGYEVPLNLYACIVGASGSKKSPLQRLLVEAPSKPLRVELAAEHKRQVEAIREKNRGIKPAEREQEPRPLRLQIQDYTGEALAAQLARQEEAGLGLLVARDEIAGLLGTLNAYRGGRGGDEQQLLELYDGDAFASLRVTAGDRTYSRCHLSIYGNTQPAVLADLAKGGDPTGKWARFLFAPLPDRVAPLPTTISPEEREEVAAAWNTLQTISRHFYTLPCRVYQLDAEALAAFSQFEAACQRHQLDATLDPHRAIHGKQAGKVLRVAGLLQLQRIVAGEEADAAPIGLPVLQRAMAYVTHLDGWALGLHSQLAAVGEGGVSELMRKVHRTAERQRKPIGWRDVRHALSKKERMAVDRDLVAAAMKHLEELQVGEVTSDGGQPRYRATGAIPP